MTKITNLETLANEFGEGFSRDEMAVYDAIVAAGDSGITLGDLAKRFGASFQLAGILTSFLQSFIIGREGARFYASENL